jgi:uncharacterized membrane protein
MILATLGILDDITISQTVAVHELSKANTSYGFLELFRAGLNLGREHIASLVNTLFLVYAGVSLSLFLLFTVQSNQPWWLLFNSEYISQEVVRAIVGSIALIVAVPVATALAAYYYGKKAVVVPIAVEVSEAATPEKVSTEVGS